MMDSRGTWMKMWRRLYGDVFEGSMAGRKDALVLFMYLISRADDQGFVRRSGVRVVMACTGLTEDEYVEALKELEGADPQSRSKEEDGRRLIPEDDGWLIVNFKHYQGIQREEHRRERVRKNVAAWRARRATVSSNQITPDHARLEERRGEESGKGEVSRSSESLDLDLIPPMVKDPDEMTSDQAFDQVFWPEYPRKIGRKPAFRAWRALKLRDDDQQGLEAIMAALDRSKRDEFKGRELDKIPYPATWLNARRWEDSREAASKR